MKISKLGSNLDRAGPAIQRRLRPHDIHDGALANRVHSALREALAAMSFAPGAALRKLPNHIAWPEAGRPELFEAS